MNGELPPLPKYSELALYPLEVESVINISLFLWILQVIHPSKDPKVKFHDAKDRNFRELYEQQLSHRSIMAQALA